MIPEDASLGQVAGEAFLFEVLVGRECIGDPEAGHEDEADGVAQRIRFVGPSEEKFDGLSVRESSTQMKLTSDDRITSRINSIAIRRSNPRVVANGTSSDVT
jgi:hypothetical protein